MTSCLKIIACGSNTAAADTDDPLSTTTPPSQTKASSDKRGWSFRKNSGRHRMTQSPSPTKDILLVTHDHKPTDLDHKPTHPSSDSKTSSHKPNVAQLLLVQDNDSNSTSTQPDIDAPQTESLVSNTIESDESKLPDESVVIIIQASIRAFLLKNVVKLQAVIRGYLVRRNAIGTLHCIQGISKLQALVRAHSSKSFDHKIQGRFSSVNLLQNSFARQLLKSTPKPKSVNIRCDPLSPNSAWGWLERWMSVTSQLTPKVVEPAAEMQSGDHLQSHHSQTDAAVSSTALFDSSDSRNTLEEMTEIPESQGYDDINSQSFLPIHVEEEQHHHLMTEEINEDVNSITMDAHASVIADPQVKPVSLPDEAAAEIQQPKLSMKRSASEELNGEGKKLSCESRKTNDPAFILAQSQLEGLTFSVDLGRSITSSQQGAGAETPAETSSSLGGSLAKTTDASFVGVPVPSDARALVAGSECGTELSITSTLDSPDRCELERTQPEQPVEELETPLDADTREGQDCEIIGTSCNHISGLSSETTQPEEVNEINGVSVSLESGTIGMSGNQTSDITHATTQQEEVDGINSVSVCPDSRIFGLSSNHVSDLTSKTTEQEGVHGNGVCVGPVVAEVGLLEQISEMKISDKQTNSARISSEIDGSDSLMEHEDGRNEHISSEIDGSPSLMEHEDAINEYISSGIDGSPSLMEHEDGMNEHISLEIDGSPSLVEHKDGMNEHTSSEIDGRPSLVEHKDGMNEHISSEIDGGLSLGKHKDGMNEHDVCIEHGSATGLQANISTPEASPRSHVTVPESQGTPSSQVSVKGKRNKSDKSGSHTKRSSRSAEKRSAEKKSPSNTSLVSGARTSVDNLPKDLKSGKRRASFGSTKSDNTDQEPRDSNSHNSLPSYMQATKSAKAKAYSPKSSPDFHDKEVDSKKRHSLPGAGGRQGSPRVERSSPQAAQGAKGNGPHHPNERKWQR